MCLLLSPAAPVPPSEASCVGVVVYGRLHTGQISTSSSSSSLTSSFCSLCGRRELELGSGSGVAGFDFDFDRTIERYLFAILCPVEEEEGVAGSEDDDTRVVVVVVVVERCC